jgi:hypothetical protein
MNKFMKTKNFISCMSVIFVFASCAAHSPRILAEKYRSIHIPVLKNETQEYAVEERLTRSMIETFRRDGRLRVSPHADADLELKGRITEVHLSPLAFTELDRAVGYTMRVVIHVDIIENAGGEEIIKDRPFEATGSFILSTEPTQARAQDVADSLAESVLSSLLEGW